MQERTIIVSLVPVMFQQTLVTIQEHLQSPLTRYLS
jgi:hypothetical protein